MVIGLEMSWRALLFANWPVDPDVVSAHLPDALAVDTYDGDAWLSVVPFTNAAVRPRGVPESLGVDLPELNLRTYVRVDGEPSVYFFSLDAQGVASVVGARLLHHLPYFYARIDHHRAHDGRVRFESRRLHPGARPAHFAATYGPAGDRLDPDDDSLAAFLTERYRFYTETPFGTVRYTDVDHDPWPLYPAEADVESNTLFRADGFADPAGDPVLYYSPRLDIAASPSRRR
ncbi:YqjF family protein [Candidatus Halobonum tyrrellensis]|uniref:DUF2071 domain-containing protein n=1 Tax=Candidatus Halobonum tyrrellensis G22 TaxID=1324957 RepID=V4J0A9_9EURY|nr:DUF2071 domain-containing protein [Candidatus Halobonum tyrrellensis]ESP88872.1 hypothetical protein K933_06837 [Candidatus Halobonum tyrrellensis G22]